MLIKETKVIIKKVDLEKLIKASDKVNSIPDLARKSGFSRSYLYKANQDIREFPIKSWNIIKKCL